MTDSSGTRAKGHQMKLAGLEQVREMSSQNCS